MRPRGSLCLSPHIHPLNLRCRTLVREVGCESEYADRSYSSPALVFAHFSTAACKDVTKPDMLGYLLWIREGTFLHREAHKSVIRWMQMYYSGPIRYLLWDSDLHLPKSHLTALLRAGVGSHIIHFAISRKIVRYISDIKHFTSSSLPELLTSAL